MVFLNKKCYFVCQEGTTIICSRIQPCVETLGKAPWSDAEVEQVVEAASCGASIAGTAPSEEGDAGGSRTSLRGAPVDLSGFGTSNVFSFCVENMSRKLEKEFIIGTQL